MKLPQVIPALLPLLHLSSLVWAQTPIPPSTFGGETSTGSASSSTSNNATSTTTANFPSLTGFSSCVTNCLAMGSAAANCSSMVDINCFCVSSRFTSEMVDCIISMGCPQELTTAESLAQQFCNVASNKTSLSFPTPTLTSTTASITPTSSSNSTSSTFASITSGNATTTATTSSRTPAASSAAMSKLDGGPGIGVSIFYAAGVGLLGTIFSAYS